MAEVEQFEIVTTAQVERVYVVTATDEDQAKARLRVHLKDPETLREGVVVEQKEKQKDTTTQQMKSSKKVAKPRAVREPLTPGSEATG